jgi:hypothetical protein
MLSISFIAKVSFSSTSKNLWVSLHPNGRLCCPGYEFMLCAANIKLLLCDCLEPRAPTPAQADQIVRLLKVGLGSRGNLGGLFRLAK